MCDIGKRPIWIELAKGAGFDNNVIAGSSADYFQNSYFLLLNDLDLAAIDILDLPRERESNLIVR